MIYMMYILILYVLVWVRLCDYAGLRWTGTCVSSGDKECIQKQKEGRVKEREREFLSVCEGTLSSSPQNPRRGLPCQSISWSWLQPQWDNAHTDTHTRTSLALSMPLWKLCNLAPTHRETVTHTQTWPIGMTARKWQAAAGGSLRSSTETVAP